MMAGAHELALLGVNPDYSWYSGAEMSSGFLSTHKINVWWEVVQGQGTSPAWSAQDRIEITKYKAVAFDGTRWVNVGDGNLSEGGQYIDGGLDGTWTAVGSFGPGSVRYDSLQRLDVNAVHGWNAWPNRWSIPAISLAVHPSCWMRLTGPNAVRNSGQLVACCTSDRYNQDNSPDNYSGISHPRFTALTSEWRCYSAVGFTNLVPQPQRTDLAYVGQFLAEHSDWPANTQP